MPWAARDGLLVNLAGAAPWFAFRQACLLHDAAVYDHPGAYSRAFVLWYRLLFAHLARRAVPLMTVSEFSRQRLAVCLQVPEWQIALVPNGADHLDAVEADAATLARFGLEQSQFLLAVASENPTKNLPALVSAFASLGGHGGLRLVLVGGRNGHVFAPTDAPADPPGVVRTGPLGDAALKALYGKAMALVFPSLYEGFGLPPLEAMSCGCPVLAARAAAVPEVCGDAVRYFDPHSVAAIAAALREVLADAALRHRLRLAGAERATHFRWLNCVSALLRAVHAGSP